MHWFLLNHRSDTAAAQAGLNLNLVGAISGAFSGKGKKTTDTKADGSSHSVEDTKGHGTMAGSGAGTLNAVGEGKANTHEKYRKTVEADESESKSKGESKSKAVKQTDHLGLGE